MPEEDVPPWFGILRGDMSGMESRITAGMDRMVTKDVFEAEQRSHAERHRLMDERLREERDRAEAAEKGLAAANSATAAAVVAADAARKAGARRLWIGLGTGLSVLAALIAAIGAIAPLFQH